MYQKLNRVMLIDDNPNDNMYHKRVIKKSDCTDDIIVMESPLAALEYLSQPDLEKESLPELIFLDINMPRMNGWEFLEAYKKLPEDRKSSAIVVMLSTSLNPEDKEKAEKINEISKFLTKPLDKEALRKVLEDYFGDSSE